MGLVEGCDVKSGCCRVEGSTGALIGAAVGKWD